MPIKAESIWQAALGELQLQVSKANFNTWLKGTRGIDCSNGSFLVAVPTAFIAEWLTERLSSLINRTVSSILGQSVQVRYVVQQVHKESTKISAERLPDGGISIKMREHVVKPTSLNPKFTFESFVTGDCNRLPYTAAIEIADNPGMAFNPLVIYGSTGTGKTHLLHAIGHTLKKNNISVLFISSEQFTNDFVAAIRSRKAEEFRQAFNNVDVLLFDDIQFLGGKTQTQECIFHIISDFIDDNRQVVITCDRSPREIDSLNVRLLSRLEGGLLADLYPPDYKTRLSIIELRAQQMQVKLNSEVSNYLATNFFHNVRELEGAFLRLATYARLAASPIDLSSARKILGNIMSNGCTGSERHSPAKIIRAVSDYFGISHEDITGHRRDLRTSRARHIAMYLLREHNHCSLSEIGRVLGDRDHSTVIYGCEKISSAIPVDAELRKTVEDIAKSLRNTD